MISKKVVIRDDDEEVPYEGSPADTLSCSSSSMKYRTISPCDSLYAAECLKCALEITQEKITRQCAKNKAMLRSRHQPSSVAIDADALTLMMRRRGRHLRNFIRAELSSTSSSSTSISQPPSPQPQRTRIVKSADNAVKNMFERSVKAFMTRVDDAKGKKPNVIRLIIDCTKGDQPLFSVSYNEAAEEGKVQRYAKQPECCESDVSNHELQMAVYGVESQLPKITREEALLWITDSMLRRRQVTATSQKQLLASPMEGEMRQCIDRLRQYQHHRRYAKRTGWLSGLIGR